MRIWLAIQVFFKTLFDGAFAGQVRQLMLGAPAAPAKAAPAPAPVEAAPKPPAKSARSEAITLLATLQREARFVDFIKESLADYSDAQIGAAARDVHRDCGQAIDRMFAIKPLTAQPEGVELDVPTGFDAGRFQLTGNVAGEPPFRGHLVHHGWEATKCELPTWNGNPASAKIVAPTEVELK